LAPQSSGSITQDSLSFDFHIDSTGLDSALTSDLVANVIFNNSFSSLRSTKTAFAIEGEIIVLFAHKMDNESVERSIMTAPSFSPNFFWQDNMLTIVPANSLVPQTNYTLTIGSGAQTSDSVKFRVPYAINFTTGSTDYFREYWPLDKEIGVARNVPFRFSFNYSVEPALLNAAFSITPLVDSLSFSTKKAGEILIGHAELLPDTTYKIVIDGSLSSSKGTVLGKDLQISFRTSGTLK
jgi:hypothetical protein